MPKQLKRAQVLAKTRTERTPAGHRSWHYIGPNRHGTPVSVEYGPPRPSPRASFLAIANLVLGDNLGIVPLDRGFSFLRLVLGKGRPWYLGFYSTGVGIQDWRRQEWLNEYGAPEGDSSRNFR
jgi:hypothetical protein